MSVTSTFVCNLYVYVCDLYIYVCNLHIYVCNLYIYDSKLYIYSQISVKFGTDNLDMTLFNNFEFLESGHSDGNISRQGGISFCSYYIDLHSSSNFNKEYRATSLM